MITNHVPEKSELFGKEIHAIHYFPSDRDNDEKIIVAGNPIDINIFLLKTNEKEGTLMGMHTDTVTSLCMDGYFLFSGSDDTTIVMWNMTNFTQIGVLKGHTSSIQDMMMLKNGYLVSCAYDHKIYFWDYFKGEIIDQLTRKKEEFRCITYLDRIGILLAGTNAKSILTFNISHILERRPEGNF